MPKEHRNPPTGVSDAMSDTVRRELEFSPKPRRMTSPTWNESNTIGIFDGVEVIMETDPERIAYFAREATWGDLMREPTEEEMTDTLEEVARGGVLSAAYKGGLGFRIRASRVTMDQALRLAEGTGGAGSGAGAQTTRDNDLRNFNMIIPPTISNLGANDVDPITDSNQTWHENMQRTAMWSRVQRYVETTRKLYADLVDTGVPPQDARYIALPMGFQTQWFHVMSLGNLIKMCEHRLCNGLVQHEINYLTRVMRDLVVQEYPWMDKQLRSSCEKRGQCVSTTMLFPPCGAFVKDHSSPGEPEMDLSEARLHIRQYDPERHLYPSEQNAAMEFALWDVARQHLEAQNPDVLYRFAGPPEPFIQFEPEE
jgi:hypothetical protein